MTPQERSNRLLLIDGDLVLYMTLSAAERETCMDDEGEDWHITVNLRDVKNSINSQLRNIRNELDGRLVVCLSHHTNFRKSLFPAYKENRRSLRKPVGFKAAKAWMVEKWDAVIKPGLEADDVMGILATKPGNDNAVIVSMDKDMRGIPAKLYRWKSKEKIVVTEEEADLQWWTQTLSGDPTDNFPGCPGIGGVTAEKLLSKPGDKWEIVKAAFTKAGKTEDEALTQARIARILRWNDWNSERQEPILWTPATHRPLQPGDAERQIDGGNAPSQ